MNIYGQEMKKEVKVETNFSEKAFCVFDLMFSDIVRSENVDLSSKKVDSAVNYICNMFGYKDKTNFLNAYLCWDTEKNW